MSDLQVERFINVADILNRLDSQGFVVENVHTRENYLAICNQLGRVTHTREIFLKPRDTVEKFTGYSHLPEEVPFHTDYPLVNVVGLFCEHADDDGGENLLVDTREILKELSYSEVEALKQVNVPLPRSEETLPVLSVNDNQRPHVYWLPAFTLANLEKLEDRQAKSVERFNQVLLDKRERGNHISLKLKAGEAIWFDNFVMLHGRDKLKETSKRFQVRAFIEYVK